MNSAKDMLNQTAFLLKTNSEQLGMLSTTIKRHEVLIQETAEGLSDLGRKFEDYKEAQKEKEYIEPEQVQEIADTLYNRVSGVLEQKNIDHKYFGRFASKAWSDAKRHSYLVGKGGVYTKKMHFEDVKAYIGTWTPYGYGVDGYVQHLNSIAEKDLPR